MNLSRREVLICDLIYILIDDVRMVRMLSDYEMSTPATFVLVHMDSEKLYKLAVAIGVYTTPMRDKLTEMRKILERKKRNESRQWKEAIAHYKDVANRDPGYRSLAYDQRIALADPLSEEHTFAYYAQDDIRWLNDFEPILIDAILDIAAQKLAS